MARFHKFTQPRGEEILIDLDSISAVKADVTGATIYLPGWTILVTNTVQGVLDLIFPLNTLVPQPAPAPVNGDEGDELAALRERVRELESLDGFQNQRRRIEALKKARIFELEVLVRSFSLSHLYLPIIKSYVAERRLEIERGGGI